MLWAQGDAPEAAGTPGHPAAGLRPPSPCTHSMETRNCTVSSGCGTPGRTASMKKLGRKIRSWGPPSWNSGYLRGEDARKTPAGGTEPGPSPGPPRPPCPAHTARLPPAAMAAARPGSAAAMEGLPLSPSAGAEG